MPELSYSSLVTDIYPRRGWAQIDFLMDIEIYLYAQQRLSLKMTGRFYTHPQGWGLLSQFSPFHVFPIRQNYQNTGCPYNTTLIFDRCHHS